MEYTVKKTEPENSDVKKLKEYFDSKSPEEIKKEWEEIMKTGSTFPSLMEFNEILK